MSGCIKIVLTCILALCITTTPCPAGDSADFPGASSSGMPASDNGEARRPGTDPAEADHSKPGPAMSSADAMSDIHDIRPPRAPGLDLKVLAYGLAGLAAVLLAAAMVYLWKRRRRRLKGGVASALSPDVVALSALDELNDVNGVDGRLFYFRLSAVLRRYIHERCGIPASEMTTEELLPEIDRLGLDHHRAASLKQLFSGAEPVKYAGRFAVVNQMEKDLGLARTFIRETLPVDDGTAETGEGIVE